MFFSALRAEAKGSEVFSRRRNRKKAVEMYILGKERAQKLFLALRAKIVKKAPGHAGRKEVQITEGRLQ